MTPGKSTSTILWMPGPLTLKDIVWFAKNKHHYSMNILWIYRSKSEIWMEALCPTSELTVCPSFTLFLILSSISCLRAASYKTKEEMPDITVKIGKNISAKIHIKWTEWMTLWLTSSSLVRSNSRPLSLNKATWWGPSLSVTCRQNMWFVKGSDTEIN